MVTDYEGLNCNSNAENEPLINMNMIWDNGMNYRRKKEDSAGGLSNPV